MSSSDGNLSSDGSGFDFRDDVSMDSAWSPEEDKIFETALAELDDISPERWADICLKLPGRTVDELQRHYQTLVEDIAEIERGPAPVFCGADAPMTDTKDFATSGGAAGSPGLDQSNRDGEIPSSSSGGKRSSSNSKEQTSSGGAAQKESKTQSQGKTSEQERRKGIPWTEEEHRLFLLGLAKFGKGDWRSISRNFVISRTPTQVASHAQKYFIRLNSINKDKRRSSIHDITSVSGGEAENTSSGPITGQPTMASQQTPLPPPPVPNPVFMPGPAAGMPHMHHPHMMPLGVHPSHIGYGPRAHMARPVLTPNGVPLAHMGFVPQPALHH